jgi:hypothetical protein
MANRQDRRGRSKGSGRFVQLHHWVMDTPAWADLRTPARAVYVEIARLYNGTNNGLLALSARDAARRCHINKDTATRAFRELIDHGFIHCATPGGFSRKVRHATEWRLAEYRCDKSGSIPTKAFVKWRPIVQNAVPIEASDGPKIGSVEELIASLARPSVLLSGP